MSSSPIRLLLVEDSPADAVLLQHLLAEAGGESFHVTHVELMAEAIACLERDSFDAILLDLSLPDSHGICTVARASAAAPQLPIVVMTGLDDEATAVKVVRKGAQDYLVKGHADGRLMARAIRYAMERKQAEQQLKALNETLEQRVAERTAVATRRAAQLQVLASELTRTEHRERRRLAQILHDHLQQLLYAARLSFGALRRADQQGQPTEETVERVDALLNQSLDVSRSLTAELSPPVLYETDLAGALEWLGRYMQETCGLAVAVEADTEADPESEDLRILLFEAARAAVQRDEARPHRFRPRDPDGDSPRRNPDRGRGRGGRTGSCGPGGIETRHGRLRTVQHPRACGTMGRPHAGRRRTGPRNPRDRRCSPPSDFVGGRAVA